MTTIVFRVDSSEDIGSGHLIRCRNLARSLQARGAYIIFICRPFSGNLIHLLDKEFSVLKLPALRSIHEPSSESINDIYATWLGTSQSEDALETTELLKSSDISVDGLWLIIMP